MCVKMCAGKLHVAVQAEDDCVRVKNPITDLVSKTYIPSLNHHGGRMEHVDRSVEDTVKREVWEETGGLATAPDLHRQHTVYLPACKQLLFVEDTTARADWEALPANYQAHFQGLTSHQMGETGDREWSRAATHQMWLPLMRQHTHWCIDSTMSPIKRLKVALELGLSLSTHLLDTVAEKHTMILDDENYSDTETIIN